METAAAKLSSAGAAARVPEVTVIVAGFIGSSEIVPINVGVRVVETPDPPLR